MTNKQYITDLIDRMLDYSWPEGATSSEDTASWKAYREAEQIDNESIIPEFIAFIEAETNDERRRTAYWILGKISENIAHLPTLQYLIDSLDKEKIEKIQTSILSSIRDIRKPAAINLLPIFNRAKTDNEEVKNEAILALSNTENPEVEPLILNFCQGENSDEYRLWRCISVLANIGSRASLPVLETLAGHKKMDVSISALYAILKIGDERELPIFEKYIQEGRNKDVALFCICKLGNETHIPLIIKRMKEVLGRKRSQIVYIGDLNEDKSELMHGAEFLQKYQNAEIQQFFEFVTTKKWDKLFKEEQRFFTKLGI